MRWVLSPPSSTGFHYIIICTGGSAAARLSCLGVGRSPKTEPPAMILEPEGRQPVARGKESRRRAQARE